MQNAPRKQRRPRRRPNASVGVRPADYDRLATFFPTISYTLAIGMLLDLWQHLPEASRLAFIERRTPNLTGIEIPAEGGEG